MRGVGFLTQLIPRPRAKHFPKLNTEVPSCTKPWKLASKTGSSYAAKTAMAMMRGAAEMLVVDSLLPSYPLPNLTAVRYSASRRVGMRYAFTFGQSPAARVASIYLRSVACGSRAVALIRTASSPPDRPTLPGSSGHSPSPTQSQGPPGPQVEISATIFLRGRRR